MSRAASNLLLDNSTRWPLEFVTPLAGQRRGQLPCVVVLEGFAERHARAGVEQYVQCQVLFRGIELQEQAIQPSEYVPLDVA